MALDDDAVQLLSHKLEELDYSLLYQAYSAKGRKPAVVSKAMFKILIYTYSQNIYSSGKTETACRRYINFMQLLAGQKAPDHSTIARFRIGFLADACENLFYQMAKLPSVASAGNGIERFKKNHFIKVRKKRKKSTKPNGFSSVFL